VDDSIRLRQAAGLGFLVLLCSRAVYGHDQSDQLNQAPDFQGAPNSWSLVLVSYVICSCGPSLACHDQFPKSSRSIHVLILPLDDCFPFHLAWFPSSTCDNVSDPCWCAPSPLCRSSLPDVDRIDQIHHTHQVLTTLRVSLVMVSYPNESQGKIIHRYKPTVCNS
jgi:hypothetical protein